MSANPGLMIAKSDGSREPFQVIKLRRCLSLALRDSGMDENHALPLADAVRMHLEQDASRATLTSEYVFQCAIAVLTQTGATAAAEELQRHQRERDGLRRRTRVFDPRCPAKGLKPWLKSIVVAALQCKHGADPVVARALAGEVEMRVFACGYQVVRTPLIAEIVKNELMSWGLIDELAVGRHSELWSEPVGSKWPVREE